ncbi:MAG: hypothetical protein AAFU57_03830 [Bacteroidota bacterium]
MRVLFCTLGLVFAQCIQSQDVQDIEIRKQNISRVFKNVDSLLSKDGGAFWGKSLKGSLLFVDPMTRVVYANENTPIQSLQKEGNLFIGQFPKNKNIANTALEWEHKKWSMVMLPLPKQAIRQQALTIHELFHQLQPKIGFGNLKETNNAHMDGYEGRLWVKLELEALEAALKADNPAIVKEHISHALLFRHNRYKDSLIQSAENELELNEGLAEYTGIMLSGATPIEMEEMLIDKKQRFFKAPSFVRSYPYLTIPFYGYLLSKSDPKWQLDITAETNLTAYFMKRFDISDSTLERTWEVSNKTYNSGSIHLMEQQRAADKKKQLADLKKRFVEDLTLTLPFQQMNISFNPNTLVPLEGHGTVYETLSITDVWGKVDAKQGAMVTTNWSGVVLSEPNAIAAETVMGEGWSLQLNPGYKIIKSESGYTLKKEE